MSDSKEIQRSDGLVVEEAKPKLKRPQLFRVILINDDYTPMEFVVMVLQQFSDSLMMTQFRLCLMCTRRGREYVAFTLPKLLRLRCVK